MLGRWMKHISPFPQVAILLPLLLAGVSVTLWCCVRLGLIQQDTWADVTIVGSLVATMIGPFVYGICRAVAFHPLRNDDERTWLATTPWRWPQSLPFGAVQLVTQDAVIAVSYIVGSWFLTGTVLWGVGIVVVMLVAYWTCIANLCAASRAGHASYGIGFALAGSLAFVFTPWLAILFLVLCDIFARRGIAESLRRFPEWSHQLNNGDRLPSEWLKTKRDRPQDSLGWPHAVINPQIPMQGETKPRALLVSLIFGIWTWAGCHAWNEMVRVVPKDRMDFSVIDLSPAYVVPLVLGVLLAFCRWAFYRQTLSPSLILWGRVGSGYWILPSYDRIYLMPLLLMFVGSLLSVVGRQAGVPLEVFLSSSVTILFLLTLGAGPTLQEWRLTAACRMGPSARLASGHLSDPK